MIVTIDDSNNNNLTKAGLCWLVDGAISGAPREEEEEPALSKAAIGSGTEAAAAASTSPAAVVRADDG